MSHLRKQVRDGFKTIITAIGAFTLVTTDRVAAITGDVMPSCLIRTPEEAIEGKSLGFPRINERIMQVEVTLHVNSNTPLDAIDALALQVEQAMSASIAAITLNGVAKWTQLKAVSTDESATATRPFGQMRMTYMVGLLHQENMPDVLQ